MAPTRVGRSAPGARAISRKVFGGPIPRIATRDARREVDEAAAFHVPQLGVLSAFGVEIAHHADTARRRGILAGLEVGILEGLAHGITPGRVDRFLGGTSTIVRFGSFNQSHFRSFIGAISAMRASMLSDWLAQRIERTGGQPIYRQVYGLPQEAIPSR